MLPAHMPLGAWFPALGKTMEIFSETSDFLAGF
jgi:hypothetical protein